MQELTPPENSSTPSISLTPPEPVKSVDTREADQMVKLDKSQIPELDAKVEKVHAQNAALENKLDAIMELLKKKSE